MPGKKTPSAVCSASSARSNQQRLTEIEPGGQPPGFFVFGRQRARLFLEPRPVPSRSLHRPIRHAGKKALFLNEPLAMRLRHPLTLAISSASSARSNRHGLTEIRTRRATAGFFELGDPTGRAIREERSARGIRGWPLSATAELGSRRQRTAPAPLAGHVPRKAGQSRMAIFFVFHTLGQVLRKSPKRAARRFYLSLIRFGSEPRPNIPTVFGPTTPSNRLGNSYAIGLPRKVRLDVAKCLCQSSASKKACRGRRLPISPLPGEVVGRPERVKLDGGAPGFWTAAPAAHSLRSRRSWWLRVDRECFLKFSQISQGFNQWLDSAFIVLPVLD